MTLGFNKPKPVEDKAVTQDTFAKKESNSIGYFEAEEGFDVMDALNKFGAKNKVFATQTGYSEKKGKFYAFVWYK